MSSGMHQGGIGGTIFGRRITMEALNHYRSAEKSQKCHKCIIQCRTLAFERHQVRTQERQTCFLPQTSSSLVTLLGAVGHTTHHKPTLPSHKSLVGINFR